MSCAARSIGSTILAVLLSTLSLAAGAAPVSDRAGPRIADRAVPKAYDIGGALALRDDVDFTFQSVNGPVRIDVGRITNESATTTSGSVRAALFLTESSTPASGYYVVAKIDLGTLGPGQSFGSFADTVPFLAPPDGIYYVHLGVFEFEANLCNAPDGYCLDDYVSFTSRVQVSNGQIFDVGPPPPATTEAVEYYNTNFDHYFVTAFPNEIALLDAGQFVGWVRTGRTHLVWSQNVGGLNGVCRFFSASFAPKSSHFYTAFPNECAIVQGNPRWTFEGIAFHVALPGFDGSCGPGTTQLYRLYNNGMSGAPNHRYTVSLVVRDQMLAQGWVPEGYGALGVMACVPL